ncbi:hypothetical protein D4764_03G0002730 [Takifugu flavidus]|uniref:Immunoglobulin V-set domain-containing protein n=1 Tax=Takifugu flavidus TaxID=433684 RepID=A0A5C6N822_9TELE|nr:hypothetical protein D4764_03G0002730 [Takifugu flavidus]
MYSHTGRNKQCERKTNTCFYSFSMKNLNTSQTGTYYCAVAACGHILFGNGTKLVFEGERTKSEIQGRESVGESKCPEARGKSVRGRGRGARKVAEGQGETLENAGVAGRRRNTERRWGALEDAGRCRETQGDTGRRWGSLGSLERCWVDGTCCQNIS